eukprot:Lankesteria_metandrocarpae@DN9314_c0_g1_i1.p1
MECPDRSVVVVGAMGFIGSAFVEKSLKENVRIMAVDNLSSPCLWKLKMHTAKFVLSQAADCCNDVVVVCHCKNAFVSGKENAKESPVECRSSVDASDKANNNVQCCRDCCEILNGLQNVRCESAESNLVAPSGAPSKKFEFHHLDVTISDHMEWLNSKLSLSSPFDTIVNLGGRGGVRESVTAPDIHVQLNIAGPVALLLAAIKNKIPHVVQASSSSVYGEDSVQPFNENEGCMNPMSPYAATKRSSELIARSIVEHHDIHVTACRFFTVYGPRCRTDMAAYCFIDGVLHDKPINKFGDGSAIRAYTYVSDIVDGLYAAVKRGGDGFIIVNLGGAETHSLNDLIAAVEAATGKSAIINQMTPQPGDVVATCADQCRAKQLLGYNPKVGLREGMKATCSWYKTYEADQL